MNQESKDTADQEQTLKRGKCRDLEFATLIKTAALPHIDSFNYALSECLPKIVQTIRPLEIVPADIPQSSATFAFKRMKIWFQDLRLG